MTRREALLATLSLTALTVTDGPIRAAVPGGRNGGQNSGGLPGPTPFDGNTVREIARAIAQEPYKAPPEDLPREIADLSYDQYRDIRFNVDRSFWRPQKLPFEMQLFHRGFLYKPKIDIYDVAAGQANPVLYDPALFSFQNLQRPEPGNLGFAGFRLHAPLNRPDYYDEVCSFLGASYFRAVAKSQIYGLSARGLAIGTGDQKGEEFPLFRAFWVERPREGVNAAQVHALLDSPSCSAAFRFAIRPGESTIFDVETSIFPRQDMATAGIAPLTSMFWFSPLNATGRDEWRPAVHDSDGLLMATGRGERIWRPLNNPRDLQISYFGDVNPRGFGLMQRRRDFASYEDLEARYERRPSLWIEPIGDWGEGVVQLVEIPTQGEIHDNIVAFWRPKAPLRAKAEYRFTYRMHWCDEAPKVPQLGRITMARSGANFQRDGRQVVLEVTGGALESLPEDAKPELSVSTDRGQIRNPVVHRNRESGGWRISFELHPGNERVAELRVDLKHNERPVAETMLYRWTA
ncbi:glucan biosynthesis protein [Pseudoroseomonas globiformis]|uniref:Glucan biosynthesis protein n=1 Tax=Teichococcus globiformis TaxID=2307229 RepID=A0ABV7G472_9PROT